MVSALVRTPRSSVSMHCVTRRKPADPEHVVPTAAVPTMRGTVTVPSGFAAYRLQEGKEEAPVMDASARDTGELLHSRSGTHGSLETMPRTT